MRRLHPRGPTNRGVTVDIEGAMLGPDCVLVQRTTDGYRCLAQEDAAAIQALVFDRADDPDWLFRQCRRIAKALVDREMALAQIYGMGIPIIELDSERLKKLASIVRKFNFNPDQSRDARGRWTDEGGTPANGLPQVLPATTPRPSDSMLTPGNTGSAESQFAADNQRENKMVRDIVVQLKLSPEQRQSFIGPYPDKGTPIKKS
jgi:hypothetical protein